MEIVTVSGKWQKRIVQIMHEAGGACTIRQLRIRCGMLKDKHGTLLGGVLQRMVEIDILTRQSRGLYNLK